MKIRVPFKCHGGKSYCAPWIIDNFPLNYQNLNYGEVCGGAASTLLTKDRSKRELYNDLDRHSFNVFNVLLNEPEKLSEKLHEIDYTEENFNVSKVFLEKEIPITNEPLVDYAANEIVLRRFSRGGLMKSFAWSVRLRGNEPGDLHSWKTFKNYLPKLIERLKGIEVYCLTAKDFILLNDNEDFLFYVDPPYLPKTRKSNNVYRKDMTEKDHIELSEVLNSSKAKIALSGYQSDLYMKLYKGWNLDIKVIANHSSQSKMKEKKIECLFTNY